MTTAPQIDGVLSAGEWEGCEEIHVPGGSPTVVRAAWSDEGLYLALDAAEATPFTREPAPEDLGSLHMQDVWEIFVDVAGDARQYYEVQLTLKGEMFGKNHLLTAPPEVDAEGVLLKEFRSREWWPQIVALPEELRSASRHDEKSGRWTAEIFLPASFINKRRGGFPLQPGALRWNLVRHDWKSATKSDFLYWAAVKSGHPHLSPTRMGTLRLEPASEKPAKQ